MARNKQKSIILFFSLAFLTFCVTGFSKENPDKETAQPRRMLSAEKFRCIPILDGGRIKPLETFAQNVLLQFSGRTKYQKESAAAWLAKLLFTPEATLEDKVFLINNPAIAEALGITAQPKRRYSFKELEPALDKLRELATAAEAIEPKNRDVIEQELVRLYANVQAYTQLSLVFAFTRPHDDFSITQNDLKESLQLNLNQERFSFWDIAQHADELRGLIEPLGNAAANGWTDKQREILQLVNNLYHWSTAYHDLPLKIIPSFIPADEVWSSPWDVMPMALSVAEGRQEMSALSQMAQAYANGEQLKFDLAAKQFIDSVETRMASHPTQNLHSIPLELLYNHLKLFFWAKTIYFLVFLLFVCSFLVPSVSLRKTAMALLVAGAVMHGFSLALRIMILHRPPVSSLYETFIFVSFVCILCGCLIEFRQKNWLGIIIASIAGFSFLTIAGKFAAEGDTLQMLVAVLNSNFWLSTHVLSITTGYGGTCVAAIIGHVYLLQAAFQPQKREQLNSTYLILVGALGFALTMTFLGTNLGGIWADQSWGRFWGWDPKENGALMIILWLAILFHARISKLIGPLGLAVGSAAGLMVVMWAWFGVNLLNTGLHSYGFTSGLARNLIIYYCCQVLLLLFLGLTARQKLRLK